MGIVQELYRVEDEIIDYYIIHPEKSCDYFDENYSYINGKFHNEHERLFYIDKAWDVAIFLLSECDKNRNNLKIKLKGQLFDPSDFDTPNYLKSIQVREVAGFIKEFTSQDLLKTYDFKKMSQENIYRASDFRMDIWESYYLPHTLTLQSAFICASRYNHGIVINKT